jgi:RNA polymerase sigma-70 factor (ECF subfamily)
MPMRSILSIHFAIAGSRLSAAESAPLPQPMPQPMDEAAFQAFYGETAPKLRSYIRRVSGDAALADDILQETFYRFLRAGLPAMEKFRMKTYLYRTANSLVADHWRRLKRERRWSLERFFGGEAVESATQARDEGAMAVFQLLKPQEQSLLWLAYVEGFDHREVAAALELKEKSVRVLLFRARKKLAGLLRKQGLGPEEFS